MAIIRTAALYLQELLTLERAFRGKNLATVRGAECASSNPGLETTRFQILIVKKDNGAFNLNPTLLCFF